MNRSFSSTIIVVIVAIFCVQTNSALGQQNDLDKLALQNIPEDAQQILIVNDILPLIKTTLQNEPLQEVFSKSLASTFGSGIDLREIWEQVEQNKAFIPDRIAISAQDGTLRNIGEAYQLLVLMMISQAAISADEVDVELPKAHAHLEKLLLDFRIPNMTVFVHFRDRGAANQAFAPIKMFATRTLATLLDKDEENSVSIKGTVRDIYPEFSLRLLMEQFAMVDDSDTKSAKRLASACAGIAFEVKIDRIDNSLRLTVGDAPTNLGIETKTLGETYQTGEPEIAFGKYDMTGFKESIEQIPEIMKQFDSETMQNAIKEVDTNDFQSSIDGMIRGMSRMNLESKFRVHTEQSRLIVDVEGVGAPDYVPLKDARLMNFVPEDSSFVWVTNVASLGQKFSDGFLYIENRIAQQALKDQIKGDFDDSLDKYDMLDKFVSDFKELRTDILEQFPEQTHDGFAMIVSNKGKSSLKMTSINGMTAEIKDGLPTLVDNRINIELEDAAIPEVAFVGRARDVEKLRALVEQTYADTIKGIGRFNDVKVDPELCVDVGDLGLPSKTYELNADWLTPILKKSDIKWEKLSGDCRSHFFFVDDLFVFSTSPRLSKEMLNAAKSKKHLKPESNEVALGLINGKTLGDTYALPMQFASDILAQLRGAEVIGASLEGVGDLIGGVCSVIDEIRWKTWQSDSVTYSRYEAGFNE